VIIFDAEPAKGASWAAAGMIAANSEITPGEEQSYALQRQALPAWRELSRDLYEITGEQLVITQRGTLLVGWDASDRRLVQQFQDVAGTFSVCVERVERNHHEEIFEGLSARIREGVVVPDDAWLDPDQAVRLLHDAIIQLGGTFVLEAIVKIDQVQDGQEVRAFTESEQFSASRGILATGVKGIPEGLNVTRHHSVRPVRGITVRVMGFDRSEQPMVRAFIRGRSFYMVSRPSGYCVLGASAEESSEPVVVVGEVERLLRDALDVVPALEGSHLIETRMGLRPASEDQIPFFEVLGSSGWAWSSGHYRHGVTLAPLAALDALAFAGGTL
jgi:glycine oxidase